MTSTQPEPVIKAQEYDWSAIEARMEAARERAREARKVERTALLAELQTRGVTAIEARYNGYGDSGNVGEIDVTPADAEIGDIRVRLEDFIWGTAYGLHPGFEINDGAEGTLIWDIVKNRIDVEHADFYTERNEYTHEDI